jgi:HEAT repeat protein
MREDLFPSPVPGRSVQDIVLAAGGADVPERKGRETEERLTRIEQAMVARDKDSLPLLRKWATWNGDERVRERSIGALTLIRDADSSRLFLDRLSRDPSPRVRRAAAEAIGILNLSGTTSQVAKILGKDTDPYVRAECARALGRIKARDGGAALMVSLVKDPSPEVRALCADALSNLRIPESPELLRVVAQQDSSTLVRIYAVRALAVVDPAGSAPVFRSVWEGSTDPDLRVAAYRGLLLSRSSGDWESVGLADFDERIRFLAFRSWLSHAIPSRPGAGLPRNPEPIATLEAFLKDPVRGIRELAKNALERQGFAVRPDGFGYAIEK